MPRSARFVRIYAPSSTVSIRASSPRIRRRACRNGCRAETTAGARVRDRRRQGRGASADLRGRLPDSGARYRGDRIAARAAAPPSRRPRQARMSRQRAADREAESASAHPRRFAAARSRSSAGPTSASRRCSMLWSARASASPRTRRRRRATASSAFSRHPLAQFVFVDTPGFQTAHRSRLNDRMNRAVRESLGDVDVDRRGAGGRRG